MILDKKPFQSKKFIAFIFASIILAGILITALLTQAFGWAMVTFMTIGVFGVCSLAIGYILPQAKYDRFVQGVASIAKRNKE